MSLIRLYQPLEGKRNPDASFLKHALQWGNLRRVKRVVRYGHAPTLFEDFKREFRMSVVYAATKLLGYREQYSRDEVTPETIITIFEELINAGADVNEQHPVLQDVPLRLAIYYQNLSLCKCLIRLGADVHFVLPRGYGVIQTALREAVISGSDFVALILQHNAQPTEQDDRVMNVSGLGIACHYCKHDVLELFISWYEANGRLFPWYRVIRKLILQGISNRAETVAVSIFTRSCCSEPDLESCFFLAAKKGFVTLMREMVERYPQLLQSDWLVNNQIPVALQSEKHTDFVERLEDIRSQPLQLQLICRVNILRPSGTKPGNLQTHIDSLPLADSLKKYLVADVML